MVIYLLVLVVNVDKQQIWVQENGMDSRGRETQLWVHISRNLQSFVYVFDTDDLVVLLIVDNNLEFPRVKVREAELSTFLGLSELIGKQVVSINGYLFLGSLWLQQIVSYDNEVLLLLLFVAKETYDSLIVIRDQDAEHFVLSRNQVSFRQVQKVMSVVIKSVSRRLL